MKFSPPEKGAREEEEARDVAPLPTPLGEKDLWEYHLRDHGGAVRCTGELTFAYYATSSGTVAIRVVRYNASSQTARCQAYGPQTFDGERLYAEYEVRGRVLRKILDETSQWTFGEVLTQNVDQAHEESALKSPRSGVAARRILGLPLPMDEPKKIVPKRS